MVQKMLVAARLSVVRPPARPPEGAQAGPGRQPGHRAPPRAPGRGCERSGPYFFVFGNSPRATCGRGERQRRRNSMREKQ